MIGWMTWIQAIKLRKQGFDRLERIFPVADFAVLSAYILPIEIATEERSYERFLVFPQAKNKFFFKNT